MVNGHIKRRDDMVEKDMKLEMVPVAGLPVIGKGKCGNVYELSKDRIIKSFNSFVLPEEVAKERDNSRRMYEMGVPTPKVFDMVSTGEGLGLIYERVTAQSLEELMRKNPSRMPEYAKAFGELGRRVHSINAGDKGFIPAGQDYQLRLEKSRNRICRLCGEQAYEEVVSLVRKIPQTTGVVHGDFHPDNVVVKDGKLILIDMADVMTGHPVFDLLGLYFLRVYKVRFRHIVECRMADVEDEKVRLKVRDILGKMQSNTFSEETAKVFWDHFIRAYLDTDDRKVIERVTRSIAGFSRLYMACMERSVGFLGDEIVDIGTEVGVRDLLEQKEELMNALDPEGFVAG